MTKRNYREYIKQIRPNSTNEVILRQHNAGLMAYLLTYRPNFRVTDLSGWGIHVTSYTDELCRAEILVGFKTLPIVLPRDLVSKPITYDYRYSSSAQYTQTCAIAHQSTKGRCALCWLRPSKEFHHTTYNDPILALSALVQHRRGYPRPIPTWGFIKGREIIGWNSFPLCNGCHDSWAHLNRNWKTYSAQDPEYAIAHNHQKFHAWLRLVISYWLLRAIQSIGTAIQSKLFRRPARRRNPRRHLKS